MDNENTVLTEQNEAAGTPDGWEDAAFNAGWDDDGLPYPADEAEDTAEESEGTEADADQQEAEGTDGEDSGGESAGEADGETQETESEGEEGKADQPDGFVLKHLGEERTVTREEAISLAQKGMDYDRIREKWDAVKDDVPRLRMYESFLKELAEARGGDIDALIDETRTRALLAKAEAKGEDLSAAAAAAMAVRMRTQGVQEKGTPAEQTKESQDENKAGRMIDDFFAAFGRDINPNDIPQDVWNVAKQTGDLVKPYQRYLNRKLEEENKKLQKELKAAKQQQKNAARSAGSSRSEGSGATKDPFDDGWGDAW